MRRRISRVLGTCVRSLRRAARVDEAHCEPALKESEAARSCSIISSESDCFSCDRLQQLRVRGAHVVEVLRLELLHLLDRDVVEEAVPRHPEIDDLLLRPASAGTDPA